jgi:hypothetical protein
MDQNMQVSRLGWGGLDAFSLSSPQEMLHGLFVVEKKI